jgi:predicted nucleotidyltransferase
MNWNDTIDEDFKGVLETLQQAFEALGINYYVIGAVARDIWYAESGKTSRRTKDIDFAIFAGNREEYGKVKEYLQTKEGYRDSRGNAFVLLSPGGTQVDILPFGDIEMDGVVEFDGTGLTDIKVDGLKEVFESGTASMNSDNGRQFQVASLAAIVLLKLVAYDDRPEKRLKDARDIGNILENYFELQSDLVYTNHNDLFSVEEVVFDQLTLQEVGAEVVGREIKKIIHNNVQLLQRVQTIVANHLVDGEEGTFAQEMAAETGRSVSEMLSWLEKLAKGLR